MSIKVEQIGGTGECEVTGAFSHTEIYVALLENFKSMTAPKDRCGDDAAKTLEELVTITEPHTFKDGFGFTKIEAIAETVKLETTQLGDVNKSPVFENKFSFQMLGSKPEILGFKRQFKGRDLVIVAVEYASGHPRQIGSARFGAKFSELNAVIESAVEGENTSSFVAYDKQNYDAPIYKETITMQPTP